jgi:hypothetical protein
MYTIVRLLLGAGLFSLGYYVGREVGRLESLREELSRLRETREGVDLRAGHVAQTPHAEA